MDPNNPHPAIEQSIEELRRTCLLVDVRTPGEFAAGHIEGALNVPLPEVAASADEIVRLASGRQVALVCRTGKRAETARGTLDGRIDMPIHVLDGGMATWERSGLPVARHASSGVTMSLERQTRIVAGSFVVAGTLLGHFVAAGFLVVPAFVGAGLAYAGITDTCGMGLMLARMPWNRGPSLTEAG